MIHRISERATRHPKAFILMVVLIGFTILQAPSPMLVPRCGAEASHFIGEFCYSTQVSVAKSTAGDLDDYPIAVTINLNDLVDANRIGEHGWDIVPADSGLTQLEGFGQDINTAADTTYWIVGDLIGSATVLFDLFTGNATYKLDQGMYFHQSSGTDIVTVTDHADLQITDNLDVIVNASTLTPDAATLIVDKQAGLNGYSLGTSTTGSGKLIATVGSGAATDTLEVDWTGAETTIRMRFDAGAANDLDISFLVSGAWVSQGSKDTAYASLNGAAGTDLTIGSTFNGHITEVEIRDNVGAGSYGKVSQWSFNPGEITQSQQGTSGNGWTYLGTVTDVISTHDGSYSLVNSQANLTTTLGPTALTFGSSATEAVAPTSDIVGDFGQGDFSSVAASPAWQQFGTLGGALNSAVGSTDLAPTAFKFLLTLALAGFLGGFVYLRIGRNETVFAFIVIAVFGLAAGIDFIPAWWAVIPGLIVLTGWLLTSAAKE